jgi:hypothetical protein
MHRALNDDPAVPGLRVATVFCREDGTGLPPREHDLDEAENSVVVLLADDEMVIEPTTPSAGRRTWAALAVDLWGQCEGSKHRFLPFQLSEAAWPLDPALAGTNFSRGFGQPESRRTAWCVRTLVVELCRYLQGLERGERLPMTLFLSHAKGDISKSPKVFEEIVAHLEATKPIRTWIDSAEIEGGSRFAEAIESGVKDHVLLVLATPSYGTRPWCRKELLLAKRYERPVVIIDAHEGLETRSFPYAGNAPRLRWPEGGAQRAVDLMLKETLRYLHAALVLQGQKRAGDLVLATAPELTTMVRRPRGSAILYPDPPLGDEEMEEFEPLGLRLETPLQRAAEGRNLAGKTIVLSISESGDTAQHGLSLAHLDTALHEISRQLLVRGAQLEYGGHLGTEGYTVALFDMAAAYATLAKVPPAERILNDVGWPLPLETLPRKDRARLQAVATFRRIPRPPGVEALEPATFVEEPVFFPADSPERRYAWARGMSAMRLFQARSAGARVVLGGKTGPTVDKKGEKKWYVGRIPGVVEEALESLRAGQPLYLIGAFGGAAAMVIDLLQKRARPDFTWGFQKDAPHAACMRKLYKKLGVPWERYKAMTAFFGEAGVEELSRRNGLSIEQNEELFWTRDLTRIVELLFLGLTHLPARND